MCLSSNDLAFGPLADRWQAREIPVLSADYNPSLLHWGYGAIDRDPP